MVGSAKVLDYDPWTKGYDLHKKIGVIPQGFKFLDYPTPREAIIYYGALFGVKVDPDELLRRVILEDAAEHLVPEPLGRAEAEAGDGALPGERPGGGVP